MLLYNRTMKKRLWWALGTALILTIILVPRTVFAADNLIANPSLENGTTTPNKWQKNKWGQLSATFTYKKNQGYNSTRSVHVQVSNYQSGDAKWFFDPVAVQSNADYTFSDYYKANVKTRVVVVSYDASNTPTYFDIATTVVASNTAWKQVVAKFKTPANSTKISVYHVIERNGWLQLDAASLTKDAPTPPPTLVPNASLELSTGNPAQPASWQTGGWGTNTPQYEYINEGHTGSRSVKLTMSNYQDGDAKWFFEPQQLERGKDYRFSAWYKTNTVPHVVVRYIKDDGTDKYFGMPRPEPDGSTDWQHYTDTFSVPQDAQAVTVFFFLANNGWLQTDDYSIIPYQATGFNQSLLSLTFDDGFEENVTTVLPRLNSLGFKSTQCYATQYVEGVPGQPENIMAFKNSGHEICSHTVSHPALTTLPLDQLTFELTHSKQFLESVIGGPVNNFASPYGDYDASVNTEIKKYYRSHRTVDEGYNTKDNFNPYRIRVQNMQANTTLQELKGWLAKAKADKTWLVLVYHRVTPTMPEQFDTLESDFVEQLEAIKQSGIIVKTYNDALDELTAQL